MLKSFMAKPFLFQKSNGYYHIAYPCPYSKSRKSQTTGTKVKSTANDLLKDFINERKEGSEIAHVLFSELAQNFIETSTKRQPLTLKNYRTIIKNFINHSKDRILQDYSLQDFDKFLKHREKVSSPETANSYRKMLNAIFKHAVRYKFIKVNIIPETLGFDISEPTPEPFTKEEFSKLMSVVKSELYRDLYTFAVLSGLRAGELRQLKPSDIDINRGVINVLSTRSIKTKSKKSRQVDLHDSLIPIYEKYKHQPYMFVGNRAGKQIDPRWMNLRFKKSLMKAGVKVRKFHSLRSTFGYWLLLEETSLKYISEMMGHSTIKTTERHYAKFVTSAPMGWVNRVKLQ